MQGFQGYGYSKDFVANMTQVVENIKSSPDVQIEIISECDAICSHCPHNKEDVCRKNPDSLTRLKNIDAKVFKKLGLRKGEKIKAKDILPIIKTKLKASDIEDICRDCEWKAKCLLITSS
jgi:hypothetical protein